MRPAYRGRYPFPLKGFVYCPFGRQMTGNTKTYKDRGTFNPYYVCTRSSKVNKCPHLKMYPAGKLEDLVDGFIDGLRPEVLRQRIEEFIATQAANNPAPQMTALADQINALTRKRDRYIEQHAEGIIDTATLRDKTAAVDAQLSVAQDEMNRLRDQDSYLEFLRTLADETLEAIDRIKAPRDLPPSLLEKQRRFNDLYRKLQLRVVPKTDGTVELTGTFGAETLPLST